MVSDRPPSLGKAREEPRKGNDKLRREVGGRTEGQNNDGATEWIEKRGGVGPFTIFSQTASSKIVNVTSVPDFPTL